MARQCPGASARPARSMMASEAQRCAVMRSGSQLPYSSRSTSASWNSTRARAAEVASRRPSARAWASRSSPTACLTRGASQRVSRPAPQPRSRARLPSSPSAPSKARKRGERDTLLRLEVLGLGVVEDQRRDGGLGIHHEALGEPESDLRRIQQVEEDALVGEIGTGGVSERHAEAAIARLEPVFHGGTRRIREAPLGAQSGVEHLGQRLGHLDGESLDGMRAEVLAFLLPALRQLSHPSPARDGEHGDVVGLPRSDVAHVVGEAKALTVALPGKVEARRFPPLPVENEIFAGRASLEKAIDRVGLEPPVLDGLALELLDDCFDLERLGISLGEEALDRALDAQVLAQEHL